MSSYVLNRSIDTEKMQHFRRGLRFPKVHRWMKISDLNASLRLTFRLRCLIFTRLSSSIFNWIIITSKSSHQNIEILRYFSVLFNRIRDKQSIAIPERIVFWSNNKTFSFPGSSVDDLAYVNEILGFFENPVDLIIVAGASINHDVFVPVVEHQGHLIV